MNRTIEKFTTVLIIISIFFAVSSYGAEHIKQDRLKASCPIGIVSAMNFETKYLKSKIKNKRVRKILGRDYYFGQIDGRNVVVAQVGIGIVNAAVGTAILIKNFSPSAIIITGVAGGTSKTVPGNIIVAEKVAFYDFGILDKKGKFHLSPGFSPSSEFNGKNTQRTPCFFSSNSRLVNYALKKEKKCIFKALLYKGKTYPAAVIRGTITSTEAFTEFEPKIKEMMNKTNCIAFDMECAGVAQVCYNQHIPFVAVKAISDNGDFTMYYALKNIAANNSEILVEKIL